MKYTTEIEIDLPRSRVIELFSDPENLHKWMEGLQSYEHLTGEPGTTGSTARMNFKNRKRDIEMVETVIENRLPDVWHAKYETKGVANIQENYFRETGPNSTKWISISEFRFAGIMKFMSLFFKGAFKKQSLKFMKDFKTFAEKA